METRYDEYDLATIENSGLFRNDADTSVFFARELETIKKKLMTRRTLI